jgi:two-component system, sensor histidine kinase and response regulator
VVVAGNGHEALDAFDDAHFDVVLMDVQMPMMGGLEATRAIRAREARRSWAMTSGGWQPVPIIAMTAHTMDEDRQQCLEAGMDDFISKPVRRAELMAVIGRAMKHTREYDDEPEALMLLDGSDGLGETDIDLDQTRALLDGDLDAVQQLLQMYFRDIGTTFAELRKARDQGDLAALAQLAHTIKGTVGVFFASRVADAARTVEVLARADNAEAAGEPLAALLVELNRLSQILRQSLVKI